MHFVILFCTAALCVLPLLLLIGLVAWPSLGRPKPARFVGALGTYLCGAGLCVAMAGGI